MARTPGRAQVLWIEADPVFGGSQSQVQFPKELSPFFNLPRNPMIGDDVARAVTHAGVSYTAKKMDFHHNDVWRLNLPTRAQGLGGYAGKLLVFERTRRRDTYRLSMVDPTGPAAKSLRATTRRRGHMGWKRRDDGTRRTFGYF